VRRITTRARRPANCRPARPSQFPAYQTVHRGGHHLAIISPPQWPTGGGGERPCPGSFEQDERGQRSESSGATRVAIESATRPTVQQQDRQRRAAAGKGVAMHAVAAQRAGPALRAPAPEAPRARTRRANPGADPPRASASACISAHAALQELTRDSPVCAAWAAERPARDGRAQAHLRRRLTATLPTSRESLAGPPRIGCRSSPHLLEGSLERPRWVAPGRLRMGFLARLERHCRVRRPR